MDAMPKAVVGFNGRRDSYQLPAALQEGDLLARFLTELYFPLDSPLFRATLGRRAAERAELFTWARFREGIRHAYVEMIEAVNSSV